MNILHSHIVIAATVLYCIAEALLVWQALSAKSREEFSGPATLAFGFSVIFLSPVSPIIWAALIFHRQKLPKTLE